jgi:hypothetical protein|tara:strand:+ start:1184 stop:1465 length:282 start_codon:yes stop_codon:yes gene_type:complete
MKVIVDNLEIKIKKLISLYEIEKQEKKSATQEIENIKKELIDQREIVKELEDKIKLVKLSKVVSSSGDDNKRTKQKINDYVREIDKCIALLNK